MVNYSPAALDRVFGALADPTRRAILERLASGDTTVSELASPFSSSLPAISKHLTVLENAGLIVRQHSGRQRICHILPDAMQPASVWIERYREFWHEQLDALEEYLRSQQAPPKQERKKE